MIAGRWADYGISRPPKHGLVLFYGAPDIP